MTTVTLITLFLAGCKALFSDSEPKHTQITRPSELPPYQLIKLKRNNLRLPPIVHGKLTGAAGLIVLKIAAVKVGRTIIRADTMGVYMWQGKPGTHTFLARNIGYSDVASERLHLAKGDSVILNFQLPPGPPLVHKMPLQKK